MVTWYREAPLGNYPLMGTGKRKARRRGGGGGRAHSYTCIGAMARMWSLWSSAHTTPPAGPASLSEIPTTRYHPDRVVPAANNGLFLPCPPPGHMSGTRPGTRRPAPARPVWASTLQGSYTISNGCSCCDQTRVCEPFSPSPPPLSPPLVPARRLRAPARWLINVWRCSDRFFSAIRQAPSVRLYAGVHSSRTPHGLSRAVTWQPATTLPPDARTPAASHTVIDVCHADSTPQRALPLCPCLSPCLEPPLVRSTGPVSKLSFTAPILACALPSGCSVRELAIPRMMCHAYYAMPIVLCLLCCAVLCRSYITLTLSRSHK